MTSITTSIQELEDAILSIESLSGVPGVGEKIKKALIDHFGSEAAALKVIMYS